MTSAFFHLDYFHGTRGMKAIAEETLPTMNVPEACQRKFPRPRLLRQKKRRPGF
jgi:hypothetical protein